MSDITEFVELDPTRLDAVESPANGTSWLLLKSAGDAGSDEAAFAKAQELYGAVVKAKYSADQMRHLLAEGHAMKGPNGNIDYPIDDDEDLHNAIHAVGRGNASHDKIRRYIMRRAKEMGHSDWIPDDWNSDGSLSKSTMRVGSKLLGQTMCNHPKCGPGAVTDDNAQDEGRPPAGVFKPPPGDLRRGDGQGDTAPDESVPTGTARSQTGAVKAGVKRDVDMTGDELHRDESDTESDAESETSGSDGDADSGMTAPERAQIRHAMGKAAPGSPTWEHKDVALARKACKLLEAALAVVRQFEAREKAEARKALLPESATQAVQQLVDGLSPVAAGVPHKELQDMTHDELVKLLDERDALAARRAKKEAKKAEAKKAKKGEKTAKSESAKDAKKASKAARKEADEITEAVASAVKSAVKPLAERLSKVESEDSQSRPRPLLAGATAPVLRGEKKGSDALKQLSDDVAKASAEDAPEAQKRLTLAKMIANENARDRNPALRRSAFGPNATPLFVTDQLGDDRQVQGV